MGKTSTAARKRYNDKTYWRTTASFRKDELTHDELKLEAERQGMSLNALIVYATKKYIGRA